MNLPEKEYHSYPAWSYSMIAKYAKKGFSAIENIHEATEPTPSMRFGSLFDSMLTRGKQTLDDYKVVDEIPSGQEKTVWDYIRTKYGLPFDELQKMHYEDAIKATNYHQSGSSKWGYDACMRHLSVYGEYYEAGVEGKEIVTSEEWKDALEMVSIMRTHPLTKKIFGTKNGNGVEFIYQSQFLREMELEDGRKVLIKIMPDLIVVNHNKKRISPVDLKTSSVPGYDFWSNFIDFRYDIQASLYTDVLQKVKDEDDDYKDYEILPYIFCDISRSDKYPISYVYDPRDISQINGLSYSVGDKLYTYKNWRRLLSEILDYEERNAKVPNYIDPEGLNDLIEVIGRAR